ncbi:MAG TPA: Ig-like domain-containing domain [Puia sp.]|jgi:hypothetical protein|nr:Ig-like domain-containing domain [Puia sp.]
MKIKYGLFFIITLSFAIVSVLSNTGCANIVPPLGGPRDTIPPRLVAVTPHDSAKQFNTNKIVFNFDEYIDPKDVRTELIVSPVPKVEPIVDAKLRTLTVRLKDTLEPNTTYSLNFGRAIRDVNEGNVLKNFTYVFSTGDRIDAGEFAGSIILAATGKIDTTLVAMLHLRFDDSAVVKDRPRYIARVDSTGRFVFRYVQPGSYALYAMKDESGSHKYLSKGQLFAFADSPVVVGRNTPAVTLYAYSEAADVKPASKTATGGAKAAPPKQSAKEKEKDKRLQFQTNINNGTFDVLDTFRLQFATALKVFDTTKLRFTDEKFVAIPAKEYHFVRDSTNKTFLLLYHWPTDTKYHLIAAKDFAQDSAGRRLLKIDTISFQTKKDIEYGEVRIRIPNLNLSRNPVLQFIQGDVVKFSYPFVNRKEFKVQLFAPGEYELRLLFDDNKNGKWDSGEFFGKHRQPEKVMPIGSVKKKFNVKANWDNEVDITL